MIKLNTDYSDILKQLENLEKCIYNCPNRNTAVAYLQTYKVLSYFYCISAGKYDLKNRMKKNKLISSIAVEKSNEMSNKYMANFLENKNFHKDMFSSFYFEAGELLDEFYASDYYDKLLATYSSPFDAKSNEDLDILLEFFKEIDPSVKEIFIDLLNKGRIYELDNFFNGSGLTVFNSIDNICNVFIRKNVPIVKYLATYTHEMGHVIDYFDCGKRFSKNDQKTYIQTSVYIEALSTLYQQKFYEFLFENGVKKEEVLLNVVNYFDNYLDSMGDAILFSLIPDGYHNAAVSKKYTRDQLASIVDKTDILEDNEGFIPDFHNSMEYSYGILVANSIIHNEKKFNEFLNIRNGMFSSVKLESVGINPEYAGKQLVKNMEYFLK